MSDRHPYRLLVTGSRDWTDARTIGNALTTLAAANTFHDRPTVIVHGHCLTGADAFADGWARWHLEHGSARITVERHPAVGHPTRDFGHWPGAGPRRNAYMVELGADACFAFIGPCTSPRCVRPGPHGSHGATGCAQLAEDAGIPVRRWP